MESAATTARHATAAVATAGSSSSSSLPPRFSPQSPASHTSALVEGTPTQHKAPESFYSEAPRAECAMSCCRLSSPLVPLLPTLAYLRLACGFPLSVANSSADTVHFRRASALIRLVFVPLLFFIACGALLSYLAVVAGPADVTSGMEALAVHVAVGGVSIVAVNVVYMRMAMGLSKLLQAFPKLPQKAFDELYALAVANTRWMLFFYGLDLVSSVLYAVGLSLRLQLVDSSVRSAVASVVLFVMAFFLQFPFVLASANILCLQLLGATEVLFRQYDVDLLRLAQKRHQLLRLSASRRCLSCISAGTNGPIGDNVDSVDEACFEAARTELQLATRGRHLVILTETTGHVLGPFIAIECGLAVGMPVIAITLMFRFDDVFVLLGATVASVMFLLRASLLFEYGHRIASASAGVKDSLESVLLASPEDANRQRLALVRDNVDALTAKTVRPCSLFGLNRSNALKMLIGVGAYALIAFVVRAELSRKQTGGV